MHYYVSSVLAVSWALWFWETYLDFREYRVYTTTKQVPKELCNKIDQETFKKAKAYSIDKAKFGFISSLFSQVQSTVFTYYFLMPIFWNLSGDIMTKSFKSNKNSSQEWEICQSLIFQLVTSLVSMFINLPISIYNTFVIEQRHGFNKQTASFYAWDKFKAFAVQTVIMSPILAAIIYIVRNGGPYFFLYLWVFGLIIILLLTFFSGEIMAIFDKFNPLPEGELRQRIEKLSQENEFPLTNIFVLEGSRRSSHSNAYLAGLFNRKRIVLYDTLIENYNEGKAADPTKIDENQAPKTCDGSKKKQTGCNNEEIIAVLCHELGHWHRWHTFKRMVVAEINLFFMFLIFSKFYTNTTLYSAFGFYNEKPVLIGFSLMMTLLSPYNAVFGFLETLLSRKFEYEADEFASKSGHADNLKTALVKLNIDNLGFPIHDDLYSMFNHSHPTLIQRLKALSKSD